MRRRKIGAMRIAGVVVLVVILGAGLALAPAMAAGGPAGKDCHVEPIHPNTVNLTPQIAEVKGELKLVCLTAKASGPVDVPGWSKTSWTGGANQPPASPTPCGDVYYTSSVWLDPPGPNRFAHWNDPNGGVHNEQQYVDQTIETGSYHEIGFIAISEVANQNNVVVHYVNHGQTYGGVNGWSCRGGTWQYADYNANDCGSTACVYFTPVGVVQPPTGGGPPPVGPLLANELDKLKAQIAASTLGTSPIDPAHQVVNVPSCFWLNGGQVPPRTWVITVDGPPNASGRSVTYNEVVTIGPTSVRYDYGDGASRDGDAGTPWSSANPGACSNDHPYSKISTYGNGGVPCPPGYPHPTPDDGCYQVMATQTFSGTVTAVWFDGVAVQVRDMPPIAPFTVQTLPMMIRMQQVEGVPVT